MSEGHRWYSIHKEVKSCGFTTWNRIQQIKPWLIKNDIFKCISWLNGLFSRVIIRSWVSLSENPIYKGTNVAPWFANFFLFSHLKSMVATILILQDVALLNFSHSRLHSEQSFKFILLKKCIAVFSCDILSFWHFCLELVMFESPKACLNHSTVKSKMAPNSTLV
jgi:hypothetical protein